jgi:hypothetical protein
LTTNHAHKTDPGNRSVSANRLLGRPTSPLREEVFSAGVRHWFRLAPCDDLIGLVELDWSLARPALGVRGQLVRVLEVPAWRQGDAVNLLEQVPGAPARFDAADARPASELLVGSGIELHDGAYRPTPAGRAIRWEYSPGLDLLRGRLRADSAGARSTRFAQYLLHLNWDLRFIRIGYAEAGIALQAVLPGHDRRWVELAESALATLCYVLRSQFSWWHQPRWLVDDLFHQVDRGPEYERNPK